MKQKGPAYEYIMLTIQEEIKRGNWQIGTRLPKEEDLCQQFDVSRGTIRQALAALETAGYIKRQTKRGTTVVNDHPIIDRPMNEIESYGKQLAREGYIPSRRILRAEMKTVEETPKLVRVGFSRTGDSDEVVGIQRLQLGSTIPFALQTVYLLPSLCPDILNQDLNHLINLYAKRYHIRLVTAEESLWIATATEEEANLLEIDAGTPIIHRERISCDQFGRPFEVLISLDRGDKFRYHYLIRMVSDGQENP